MVVDKKVDKEVNKEVDNKVVKQKAFKRVLLAKKSVIGLNKFIATKNTNYKQSMIKRSTY